jgi:hypothetical protein
MTQLSSNLEIDEHRSIAVDPAEDNTSVVLTLEDPHSIAVVELTRLEVDWLITALEPYRLYERS